ncbi:tenascin-N isoform X3 [Takifugu rubripes]|uniref:tenascin-N isoform X2 n=1 Tax=Takifugu rubripes TaxID=31033 RepID=UPI0011460FB3|nr:tenascin-N isoform X2 [Takifugu rubripes]XP_029695274.1 tenascin-N isoform X3 [Takifugu rubripes]
MLFTLGLLLLLTPFPSFQSTSNERRNPTGSDVTKLNAAFTPSKPKTTAAPPKQAVPTTLKPSTVNQTVLPAPATAKSKPSPSVIQTTPSVAVKSTPASGTIANKDKHAVAVNQTVSTKSPSATNVKVLRDKPATAGALNLQSASTKSASNHSAKTTKDKLQPVLNQTVTVKPPLANDGKSPKEKTAPTGGPTLQSASTRSASTNSIKTTKDKLQPVLNQTVTVKSSSTSDGKTAKDKPAPPVVQNVQSTSPKTDPASGQKVAKNKSAPSVNQTVVDKSPSSSDAKKVAAVPAAPTKNITAGGSAVTSANQAASNSKDITPKEKPAAAQQIQVVISDGCESVNIKEQELKLKPGAPLVMTHKISLLPGGCSGGCETEMSALKERVARLEKEMSSLKDNCPCSVNCPNDCSGNGECQKGKCVCQQGFMGPDCSNCAQGAECIKKAVKGKAKSTGKTVTVQGEKDKSSAQTKGENTLSQDKEEKKVTEGKNTLSQGKEEKVTEGKNTLSRGKEEKKVTEGKNTLSQGKEEKKVTEGKNTLSQGKEEKKVTEGKNTLSQGKGEKTVTEGKNTLSQGKGETKVTEGKNTLSQGKEEKKVTEGVNTLSQGKEEKKVTEGKNTLSQGKEEKKVTEGKNTLSQGKEEKKVTEGKNTLSQGKEEKKVTEGKNTLLQGKEEKKVTEGENTLSQGKEEKKVMEGKNTLSQGKEEKTVMEGKNTLSQGKEEKKVTEGKNTLSQGKEEKKVMEGKNTISQGKEEKKVMEGESTLLQGKEQKKVTEIKDADAKPKVTTGTFTKLSLSKTQTKQEVSTKKTPTKDSGAAKTTHPTVSQVQVKHDKGNQEESRKEKTVTASKKVQKPEVKLGTTSKTYSNSEQLKDEPQTNRTQSNVKTSTSSSKTLITLSKSVGTKKNKVEKESSEHSTLPEKSVVQSVGQKNIKKVKGDAMPSQSTDNKSTEVIKIVKDTEDKVLQRSQDLVNGTGVSILSEGQDTRDKTTTQGSGSVRVLGGSGLGSVKVANVSSYSFTLMWSAPQGMFKNFTLIRTESLTEGTQVDHEEFEEETFEEVKTYTIKNTTARVQVPTESSNTTVVSESRGKAETRRISMVIPGNVRSVEFSNLRPNTAYVLQIYGSAAQRRSKIHRVTTVTGPEPATEMVFSNVTESSLSVSWSKPKTTYAAFRITYTNIVTGEYHYVTVSSQQSHVVLTKLSVGTSYIVSVMATQGRTQSDALTSIITTVPAPPTHLRVVNVTDTKALLQWTPSLGKVDRFIISYESSKTPNVTVTVMLSGNSVEHQLRGLQRGTMYTVKVLSQKDSHQSMAVSTTFTTANLVKASEVSARYAVIIWRTSTVVYHSYRLIYQVAGEETKEVILDGTMTEYKLTGLLPMSRYIVLVQGERDGRYTSIVTTEFITGKLRFPFPTDCSQELLNGALESGEVDIYPQGKEGRSVRVYCDMETDGGGWTVFQRRMNGRTDFYRTWTEYSAGFGNLSEEFWLGNDVLYNLTSVGPMSLRVDMRYGNKTVYAHYANFSIDSKERHYTLTVSGYTGNAGDSMRYHNSRPFSSWDKNPDPLGIHCARSYMGGWWYKNCYKTNLNGIYGANHDNQGIVWIDWKGKDVSIPFTEMKVRPSRFSPATHG